jgi:hypothetical protein
VSTAHARCFLDTAELAKAQIRDFQWRQGWFLGSAWADARWERVPCVSVWSVLSCGMDCHDEEESGQSIEIMLGAILRKGTMLLVLVGDCNACDASTVTVQCSDQEICLFVHVPHQDPPATHSMLT